jgi:hypothetical protein
MNKRILQLLLIALIALPAISSAAEMSVSSVTESSVSTGGIHVSAGSASSGSSNTSVSISNVVHGNTSGGTVDVQVQTDDNGVVRTQTIHKDITPGQSISVEYATSTGADGGSRSAIHIEAGATSTMQTGSTSAPSDFWHLVLNDLMHPAFSTSTGETPQPVLFFFGKGGILDLLFSRFVSFTGR